MNSKETYIDSVSGKTLYVKRTELQIRYYKDKKMRILHREDGPALIYKSLIHKRSYEAYYQNNVFHRMDGPALITSDGELEWYVNGESISLHSMRCDLEWIKV